MSTRVLLPNDVQSLIDEIRPYLAPEMKEVDVIRSVLIDFKLNRNVTKKDVNGFNAVTKKRLLKAKKELKQGRGKKFDNVEEMIKYAQNSAQ